MPHWLNVCTAQWQFYLFQLDTAHIWHLRVKFLNFIAKINTEVLSLIFHQDFSQPRFFFPPLPNWHLQKSHKKAQNRRSLRNGITHTGKFKNRDEAVCKMGFNGRSHLKSYFPLLENKISLLFLSMVFVRYFYSCITGEKKYHLHSHKHDSPLILPHSITSLVNYCLNPTIHHLHIL